MGKQKFLEETAVSRSTAFPTISASSFLAYLLQLLPTSHPFYLFVQNHGCCCFEGYDGLIPRPNEDGAAAVTTTVTTKFPTSTPTALSAAAEAGATTNLAATHCPAYYVAYASAPPYLPRR